MKWHPSNVKDGKITIYAIWTPVASVSYKVDYYYENYNNLGTFTLDNTGHNTTLAKNPFPGSGVTSPGQAPQKVGYEMSMSPEHIAARTKPVKGDGSTYVQIYYTIKRYTVTFDGDGAAYKTSGYDGSGGVYTVLHGKSISAPSYFQEPYGYSFDGWETYGNNLNNVTSDMTIKVKWKPKTVNYTFNHQVSGYSNETVTQTFGEALKLPPTSINRPGIVWLGWFTASGERVTIINSMDPLTLYSKWRYSDIEAQNTVYKISDTRFDFKSDPNYEYIVVKVGKTVNFETATWLQPNGYKSYYYNLQPNTEYELFMRKKGDTVNYIAPSNIVSILVKTTYTPLNMVTNVVQDGNTVTFKGNGETTYIYKDSHGNIITPIVTEDRMVTFTDIPNSDYKLYYVTEEINDATGVSTPVHVEVDILSPLDYDDLVEQIDNIMKLSEDAMGVLDDFPYLTLEEKLSIEDDIKNALEFELRDILDDLYHANTIEEAQEVVDGAPKAFEDVVNNIISGANIGSIQEGYKSLLEQYEKENESAGVLDIKSDGYAEMDTATTIDELKTLLEKYKDLIDNRLLVEDEIEAAKNTLDGLLTDESSAAIVDIVDAAKLELDDALTTADIEQIINETKDAIKAKTLEETKLAEIQAIADYVATLKETDYYSQEWADLLQAQQNAEIAINAASDLEGVATAKENGIAAIDAILNTEEALALAKTNATNELNALKDGESLKVQGIVDQALLDVANATHVNQITYILNEAKADVQTQLDKEAAIGEIDSAVDNLNREHYTNEQWDEILQAQQDAIDAINAASNSAGVTSAKEAGLTAIGEVKTIAEQLADAIAAAKAELDALVDDTSVDVIGIINDAKGEIELATNIEEVEDLVAKAKKDVQDQLALELDNAKTDASDTLDNFVTGEVSKDVQDIIDGAKALLENATTHEQIQQILDDAEEAIIAKVLEETKSDAKEELDNIVENPSEPVQEIIDDAKEAIDGAENTEKVEEILENAKGEITDQIKQETEDELDSLMNPEYSDAIQEIIDNAKSDLEGAKTLEEVEQILADTE